MIAPSGAVVSDLGEVGLIERILSRLGTPAAGVVGGGDDTAVVPVEGERMLITTDAILEGIDFDLSYCSGADVGWKALAVNASDIAAMCGRPAWATVSLGLPPDSLVSVIDEIVDGMLEASQRWDLAVVGGDISRASEMSLSVTMTGIPLPPGPVFRRGARKGDALCVTGSLGGAAAGLRLLQHQSAGVARAEDHPSGRSPASGAAVAALVARQLRPLARVQEAALLAPFGPSAMIDLSDGLALDLTRLMSASGTGCDVDETALPLDPGLQALFGSQREAALELAMTGGEDFELLFTIGPDAADGALEAVRQTGTECTRIGAVVDAGCVIGDRPLASWEGSGWDHLRSP